MRELSSSIYRLFEASNKNGGEQTKLQKLAVNMGNGHFFYIIIILLIMRVIKVKFKIYEWQRATVSDVFK
jgi:hypothetical protein